jgi:transposase InsO family protein
VPHGNARMNLHGRRLLVQRVRFEGRPVSHVAKEMGVSRQCAHRWLARWDAHGDAGLVDRSCRPRSSPRATPGDLVAAVLACRDQQRVGRDEIARRTGVPPRTVSRILARHGRPPLAWLDPTTGVVIRASRSTAVRYERDAPGDLLHVDVKKLGRIPDGGGWRVHGRSEEVRGRGIGFDYVHAAVDDHSRIAYAEVLGDERGVTAAGFLLRAAQYFAGHGISIREVITDNALAYRNSADFRAAVSTIGARQRFIKAHCPWQNGKVERFNRTLQVEWAYRQPFTSNRQRAAALDPWLKHYNTARPHTALGGHPPVSRAPSPT